MANVVTSALKTEGWGEVARGCGQKRLLEKDRKGEAATQPNLESLLARLTMLQSGTFQKRSGVAHVFESI